MTLYEEQQKEIETIKNRVITIKLSDADALRFYARATRGGLTISELLENFIGDLVDGTYSNGSDERMYADKWYNRCWFANERATESLSFLQVIFANNEYDDNPVNEFLAWVEELNELKAELLELQEEKVVDEDKKIHLSDIEFITDNITFLQSEIDTLWNKYKGQKYNNTTLAFDEEVQIIRDWNTQNNLFLHGVSDKRLKELVLINSL